MNLPHSPSHFIGIDVSKDSLDLCLLSQKGVLSFPNSKKGWKALFKRFSSFFPSSLVVLEATGGYEKGILEFLVSHSVPVHRADARKVKFFVRSLGKIAKTDALDAYYLALYSKARYDTLPLYALPSKPLSDLRDLVSRRKDIVDHLAQEKTKLSKPSLNPTIAKSIARIIAILQKEKENIEALIKSLLNASPELKQKYLILLSVPGIGHVMAVSLLAFLPELGQCSRKSIASLAGLAPHPKDSGNHSGYRSTAYGGRRFLAHLLHMAALTASKSLSTLGTFYRDMILRGKKHLVALTALKRKIVVIANARLRDSFFLNTQLSSSFSA